MNKQIANPFFILEMPTSISVENLVDDARKAIDNTHDEQEMGLKWALNELIVTPMKRIEHELFEVPQTCYSQQRWTKFAKANRRNPIDASAFKSTESPPVLDDFSMPDLLRMILKGWLTAPYPDMQPALEETPTDMETNYFSLEISDALFT